MPTSSLHLAAAASRYEDFSRAAAERSRHAAPRARRRRFLGSLRRRARGTARAPRVVRPAV